MPSRRLSPTRASRLPHCHHFSSSPSIRFRCRHPAVARPKRIVWVLASHTKGLASISVEGKMGEPFGPTMGEWLAEPSLGKQDRLVFLKKLLGLPADLPGGLRYQFLPPYCQCYHRGEAFSC